MYAFLSIFPIWPSFTFRTPNKNQKKEQLIYISLIQVLQPRRIHELHSECYCACYLQVLEKVPQAKSGTFWFCSNLSSYWLVGLSTSWDDKRITSVSFSLLSTHPHWVGLTQCPIFWTILTKIFCIKGVNTSKSCISIVYHEIYTHNKI